MFVLDTNTLIYYFKGMGNVARNVEAVSPRDIAIPAVVLFELETGILKSGSPRKRQEQLKKMTDIVSVIPFGPAEAGIAASIRADLEKKGIPIGPYDVLIAASALSGNHILVTHNTLEFQRIDGLKLEDWY